MKAIITDIKRFAVHDGDGIRTTVFFKGCPLRCIWCHNPETYSKEKQIAFYEHKCTLCGACMSACELHKISGDIHTLDRENCRFCGNCAEVCPEDALRIYGTEMTAEEIFKTVAADKIFYDNSGGGVTLSGGECLLYPDFCAELLKMCKQNGINTAVDTCGYVPRENFDKVIPFTDIFLYDIKAIDSDLHKKYTGVSNHRILENLKYIDDAGCKTEIRIPAVPGCNEGEIDSISRFVAGLKNVTRTRILEYHDMARSKFHALGIPCTLPK